MLRFSGIHFFLQNISVHLESIQKTYQNDRRMRKTLFSIAILAALAFQACQYNTKIQVPAARNYVQDAEVLNQYVEINDATHGFYINPNKKVSAQDYIVGQSEELNLVSPNNMQLFKQSVGWINSHASQLSANKSVDYVVLMTERDVHINRIKADSPLLLTRQPSTLLYHTHVRNLLDLSPEEQKYDIYETPSVLTAIELNPDTYRNAGWGFLVTCETGNRYDRRETRVLVCGIGYPYNPCLQWECKDSYGHDNEWYFTVQSLNDTQIGQIKFVE